MMVQCVHCGLLGIRDRESFEIVEVAEFVREQHLFRGEIPVPICIAQKLPRQQCGTKDAFFTIITEERECDRFTDWKPTFSPKEHAEMMMTERTLELHRQLETQRDDREQRRDERQREYDRWERQWRSMELAAVIIVAPLMAWLIPFLLTPKPQPALSPIIKVYVDPSKAQIEKPE